MEQKTKEQDKTLAKQEARNAAVLLLDDYIKQNSKDVAGEPFRRREPSLKSAIGRVTKVSRLACCHVANVTISCRRS